MSHFRIFLAQRMNGPYIERDIGDTLGNIMNGRLLLSLLGWPSERAGLLGVAEWLSVGEDGESTLKASILRNDSRLVARVDSFAEGKREPMLFISAKVLGQDATPVSSTIGFPPEPAEVVECAKIFRQLSSEMGRPSFLNGGPAPADATPPRAPWASVE